MYITFGYKFQEGLFPYISPILFAQNIAKKIPAKFTGILYKSEIIFQKLISKNSYPFKASAPPTISKISFVIAA